MTTKANEVGKKRAGICSGAWFHKQYLVDIKVRVDEVDT